MCDGASGPTGCRSEALNERLRDECLNVHQFASITDAQAKIEAWRVDYNQRRPHGSLGHLTPKEFVRQCRVTRAAEAGAFCSWDLSRYWANVTGRTALAQDSRSERGVRDLSGADLTTGRHERQGEEGDRHFPRSTHAGGLTAAGPRPGG